MSAGIEKTNAWHFLPVALDVRGQPCLVVGEGEPAARKIELLLRAGADVLVVGDSSSPALAKLKLDHPLESALVFQGPEFTDDLLDERALVVAASNDQLLNVQIANLAKQRQMPVNVVEQPEQSNMIFPSVIDRHPLLIAISSSGDAPVLTRLLRNRLEATIPHGLGRLAQLAGRFRQRVKDTLPTLNQRRRFWETNLEGQLADLVYAGRMEKAEEQLENALKNAGSIAADGEVYLVGAGPGDPDLLTFRALRLMRQADVVLYDRLVSPPILDLVRRDAEKINVGKARSNHTLPQQEINALLVSLAQQGRRVLRLKGGDPFIFGRGGEEIDLLADAGIPFQVVPGITAASGCAAYAGIPLTHRDYSQSVRFVTGHLKNNTCDLPWREFINEHQTLVFYMGLLGLPLIAAELQKHGMRKDMPVALVSRGTTPEQEVIVSTLAAITDDLSNREVHGPTIIIIGEVVRLREKLNWLH